MATTSNLQAELLAARRERDAAIDDLLKFTHAASHDLAEPLRTIRGFAQLLERECAANVGQEGLRFLRHILTGCERMQELLDDLLQYSRVARLSQNLRPLDTGVVCDRAIDSLAAAIAESDAAVSRDELPTVAAPEGLFHVFQCLIANAVKFRADKPPLVHVAAREHEDAWEFSVTDDGIGIDPKYHERIFAPFERLNTRTAYPGSGVGLAIVKRIVEGFRGRVGVRSEPGKGSTFHFTVPKELWESYENQERGALKIE